MPQTNPLPIVASHEIANSVIANQQAITDDIEKQAAAVTDDPLRQAQLTNSFADVAGELHKSTNGAQVMGTRGTRWRRCCRIL